MSIFRVMTFNLRTAEASDGANAWPERRELVFERIKAFAPDLLGLQEVHDQQQSQDVREALPDYAFIGVRRGGSGGAQLEMTPALVRRAAFDVLEERIFWLSRTPDVPGTSSWGAAYVRTAVQLRLRSRADGRELIWINTHLDYLPLAVVEMARMLRSEVDALPEHLPVLLTGDFNAGKRSIAYRALRGARGKRPLVDVLRKAHPDGRAEGTFHAFGRLRRPQAIDWILASKELAVRDAGIDRTTAFGRFPSDHCPVWADVIVER